MKKNVKIIGISHKRGTSRAGKDYDFHLLHCMLNDEEVDTNGRSVFSATISQDLVPGLAPGDNCLVYSHFYNGREVIDGIYIEG